jgi:hypothetical protein
MKPTKPKHTPGPWKVLHRTNTFLKTIVTDTHDVNFQSIGDVSGAENAQLIAAAPEMLEALEHVLKQIQPSDDADVYLLNSVKKVIAKAKGVSNE